jgi:hypothetical protein
MHASSALSGAAARGVCWRAECTAATAMKEREKARYCAFS